MEIQNLDCPFEWKTWECVQNHQKEVEKDDDVTYTISPFTLLNNSSLKSFLSLQIFTLNITLFSKNWTWFQESWSSIVDYFYRIFISRIMVLSTIDYFIAFWYYRVNSTISNRFWWYIICKRGAWHVTFIENFHREYE